MNYLGGAAPKAAALLVSVCLLVGAGCANKNGTPGDEPGANVKRGVKPEPDSEAVVIETDFGRMVIELYPNLAPRMVERFKTLVRSGFYDNTKFHRINPSIIQGGDPLSKDGNPLNDGTGKSDFPDLPAEFSDVPYTRAIVGAARAQPINSANSQFFVTLKRQPGFDENYTIFGRVIEGIDTADVISGAPVRPRTEAPAEPMYLRRATLRPRADFAQN